MISLSDTQWGEVHLSTIFKRILRGKVSDLRNIGSGKNIIIAAAGVNEGLSCFSDIKPRAKNAMTISFNGVGTGTAFVHNYPFNLNSDCGLVEPIEDLSIETLHFIAVSINKNKEKFNYGYKANENRLLRQTIMLPIADDGKPDYDFMERYIKERELTKRVDYIEFAKTQLARIERERVDSDAIEWRVFYLSDLFSIQRGKRLKNDDHKSGNTPYVSSSATNNGIDDYISNVERVRIFNDCLTIANSGSVGSTFYHPYHFVASDHVTSLKQAEMDKYCYLFIATLTSRLNEKYNFNREINDPRIRREKILLPVKNDEPYYVYMSNCVKSIFADKYNEYLSYAQKISC